jgi:hypothetical protein
VFVSGFISCGRMVERVVYVSFKFTFKVWEKGCIFMFVSGLHTYGRMVERVISLLLRRVEDWLDGCVCL